MDLLENYELLPEPVQKVLLSFEDCTYTECQRIISELEALGYTAEYDLSGELYDLRRIVLHHFKSVSSFYDPETKIVYPEKEDGTPDLDNCNLISMCSEEWHNSLSVDDRKTLISVS
jgi:hypothetical protein